MTRARGKTITVSADAANELLARYSHSQSITDLKEAIRLLEEALEITPQGAHEYAALLSNLGAALEALFSHSRDPGDLERALRILERALELTPPDTAAY